MNQEEGISARRRKWGRKWKGGMKNEKERERKSEEIRNEKNKMEMMEGEKKWTMCGCEGYEVR